MDLFSLVRRGPKTSEFWAAIIGTGIGLFAVKEGLQGLDVLAGLSPILAQVLGRNAVKVAGILGAARGAAAQGKHAREALRGQPHGGEADEA